MIYVIRRQVCVISIEMYWIDFFILEYGGYCNNEIECILSLNKTFGDSIKCRNRKCQCPTGYKLKENRCTSGGIIITGNFLVATVLILKSVLSVFS